jgi:SAM-dependent methyltransferase
MSADTETLKTYGTMAGKYAEVNAERDDPLLTAFIGKLAKGAHVLDLGCGPGKEAALMAAAGIQVEATDASPEMVELANAHTGVTARVATFDQITGAGIYDGIWANFCLLHAPRAAMPEHLAALKQALKPNGLFHIALKLGEGTQRDKLGRVYTYYTEAELTGLLQNAGFTPVSSAFGSGPGLDDQISDWIAITAHG